MQKLEMERIRPIRDVVYDIIRQGIVNGVYKPGEKLQEKQLAEQLGVSRTPVREALRKLEVENLVAYYPHRGTVVSEVPTDEVDELYAIREQLERFMVRRAAKNATPKDVTQLRRLLRECEEATSTEELLECVAKFNAALNALSGSDNLIELDRRVRETLHRVLISNHSDPVRHAKAHKEHIMIVDAIEAHDQDLAEQYVKDHLRNSPRVLRR